MIGQIISQYKVIEKLGEGGMGIVYKAQDTRLNRTIALKCLPDRVNNDESAKARFLQEAQAAAALNHANICTIYGVEEHDSKLYMAMEFVEGGTLSGKIPFAKIEDAVDVATQIGDALHEAHIHGIVHRDIKAENIMLTSRGQAKVMDFGLAKLKGAIKLTRTSGTVGTLGYMAPEQIQGGEVDHRSDIFSFGVLLFEMLTGKLPFRGEHEAAMMYSILNEEPEEIQKYLPDVPLELSYLVKTALEKNPDDRFQHMSDVIRDLRRLKKQTSKIHRPGASGEYQSYASVQTTSARNIVGVASSPRRKQYLLIGGIGAAVAVVAAIVWLTLFRSDITPFTTIQFSRVTSTGNIESAAISPDGRYISFSQYEKGQYSLWVRQLATSSNIQIKTPQDNFIGDPVFSKDGNFIFFRMSDEKTMESSLYKIPVLGGNAIKVLSNVQGPITFSPDGLRFAFNRVSASSGSFSLVVASVDGSNQRDLAGYKGDMWISGAPSWSPAGKIIAVPLGSWKGGFHHALISVDAESGKELPMTDKKWDVINNVRWLSNGEGLIIEATDIKTYVTQLEFVAYPSGEVSRITNDLNNYGGTTLTADMKKICTVQDERDIYLYVVPEGNAQRAKKLTSLRDDGLEGVAVGNNNEIYYTSLQGGSFDIWTINQNGEQQRQITFDTHVERQLSVSPDGKRIIFCSFRAGLPNIWVINSDGSGLKQLTKDAEDYNPVIDPSGQWVVFDSWIRGPLTVMKIPIDGGERMDVSGINGGSPVFTEDGKSVVFLSFDEKRNASALYKVALSGGKPAYLFDLPKYSNDDIQRRPNSNEISYVITKNGISNVYTRSLDDGKQKQYTAFDEHTIATHAWTPDGTSLIVARGNIRSDVVIITDQKN